MYFLFYLEVMSCLPFVPLVYPPPHVYHLCLVVCSALDCSSLCSPALVIK